jgi:hypothetical protein
MMEHKRIRELPQDKQARQIDNIIIVLSAIINMFQELKNQGS